MQLKRLYGVLAVLLVFTMLFAACTAPVAAPAGQGTTLPGMRAPSTSSSRTPRIAPPGLRTSIR